VGSLGTSLGLAHAERLQWIARVTAGSSSAPAASAPRPLALLATARARPWLADLLAGATPHVVVLSLAELDAAGIARPHDVEWLAPS